MRILHLVDEPYDSGIVSYALAAAKAMAERGHEVRVWARAGKPPQAKARALGLECLAFKRPWLGLGALRRVLRRGEAEVAVASTGASHAVAAAAAAGTSALVIRTRGDSRPMRRRPGSRLLWSRTSGFIAANAAILEEARAFAPRPGFPATVIYEGLPDPGPAAPAAGSAPLVGIVARLDPVKGHAVFLEAAAKVLAALPDARFLVVGREENVRAEGLRRQAARLGIAGALELAGHVPDPFRAMARCHFGVIASLGSEAISRAAVEWMAAGRPLVATAVGCLPEYVEHRSTGLLVPPGSAGSLAAAIACLARDGFLRERMGRAARARYEERFSWARFAAETESFYTRLKYGKIRVTS